MSIVSHLISLIFLAKINAIKKQCEKKKASIKCSVINSTFFITFFFFCQLIFSTKVFD